MYFKIIIHFMPKLSNKLSNRNFVQVSDLGHTRLLVRFWLTKSLADLTEAYSDTYLASFANPLEPLLHKRRTLNVAHENYTGENIAYNTHIPRSSHLPWFHYRINIWRGLQITHISPNPVASSPLDPKSITAFNSEIYSICFTSTKNECKISHF
jgi:hypothetical protein